MCARCRLPAPWLLPWRRWATWRWRSSPLVGGLALLRRQILFGTTVSLGLVITFLAYVQRFNQPIQQIAMLWTNLQNAIAGGERIFSLLDVEPEIMDKPEARAMPPIKGEVEFENVCAAYKAGRARAAECQLHRRARPDDRHRRPDRRGQDHDHQPDPTLL